MHHQRAFTLIELMVTLTVSAVLLAAAVPAMSRYLQDERQFASSSSLSLAFNYARNEVIKEDAAAGVTVCASSNGLTCAGNWNQGWIVLANATNTVLQAYPALSANTTLIAANGATSLLFLPNGRVSSTTTTQFALCDSRHAPYAIDVEVNTTGRVAISSTPGLNLNGTAITCP